MKSNVLIVGRAKSGTTLISKAIQQGGKYENYHLEPKNIDYFYSESFNKDTTNTVKIIFEHWNKLPNSRAALVHSETCAKFDKVVFIVRDLRDEMISRVLYVAYILKARNKLTQEQLNSWIELLQQKERAPQSISFIELCEKFDEIFNETMAKGIKRIGSQLEPYQKFLNNQTDKFHIIRYEDFISGNISALEDYLGFCLPREVSLDGFERTRRSTSFNNWKEFFLPSDVDYFKDRIGSALDDLGYDDWQLNIPENLDATIYSGYVANLVK